jgi:hypothetical protein
MQQLQNACIANVNTSLADLLAVRQNAVASLRKIRRLAQHFTVRERALVEMRIAGEIDHALQHVEATLTAAEIAESTLQGVTAGGSAVLGAWALSAAAGGSLVSGATAGVLAGLGIVPAAVSGAAGVSVAAGGAVAGAAVLGSLVVIPAAAAVAVVSHFRAGKKIKEIETVIAQVRIEAKKVRARQMLLENMERRAVEITTATKKAAYAFSHELLRAHKRLFPLGFLSRWFKGLRKLLGGNYFSRRDVAILSPLLQLAELLAKLIDQQVLDGEGKVQ